MEGNLKFLFVVNVDWYFCLHWLDRAVALQKSGYEVHVLTSITSKNHLERLESCGFVVHKMSLKRVSLNFFKETLTVFQIFMTLRCVRPTLVHLITIKPAVYGGLLVKILKLKSVASLVGVGILVDEKYSRNNKYILVSFIKLLMSICLPKHIVLENKDDKEIVTSIAPSAELNVIEGAGVNLELFNFKHKAVDSPIKVLFASRLLWAKGLDSLIHACNKLRADGVNYEVHVAGIRDHDSLDAIPDAVINAWVSEKQIVWHGQVDNMPDLLSKVDVVCLPTSYGEGVPRILIEAASCGKPIVTTDISGCREVVKHEVTGLLYSSCDKDGLYNCLHKMSKLTLSYSDFGLAARELVVKRFSNEVVIRHWLKYYREVAIDRKAKF